MTASPLDADDLRRRVQVALEEFLGAQAPALGQIADDLSGFTGALDDLIGGGKRLRPAFCYWGWRGAGGAGDEAMVRAAASLELLHACALIHDDVMDASDTRRGMPAVHRRFAALHRSSDWVGSADGFGTGAAILLGDLCLVWSDELFTTSGLPAEALTRARPVFDAMRTELMAGQYLDLLEQAKGGGTLEHAMRVVRYKSAKYTVERPLLLGGALAGAAPALREVYSAYGLPLGEAFQLRDDVLGVFGDPGDTGKPAGDDLREGKRTALVALTLARATPAQAAAVEKHLGDPGLDADGVETLRGVIRETGALREVESTIEDLTARALEALNSPLVREPAREVLTHLAHAATERRG